jgi:hypothetical protein
MKKVFFMCFALSMVLSGCSKVTGTLSSGTTCGDDEPKKLLTEQVRTAITKQMNKIATDFSVDQSWVRASVDQLKISLENVRTSKSDPDSTKKFCESTVKVVIPMTLLDEADKARESLVNSNLSGSANFNLPIRDLFRAANFEVGADTVQKDVSYSVQPTDDGKKVYLELQNPESVSGGLAQLLFLTANKGKFDQMAQNQAQNVAAESKLETVVRRNAVVVTQTGGNVLLRSTASKSASMLGKVFDLENVIVVGETSTCEIIDNHQGCWVKVLTNSGKTGYLFDAYIKYQ